MAGSALNTVQEYIDDVRTLLQDTVAPYRYGDDTLITAFNVALMRTRALRADLFLGVKTHTITVPTITTIDTTVLDLDEQFRLALVYGIAGHAMTRDQEDIPDARAAGFLKSFNVILIGVAETGVEK